MATLLYVCINAFPGLHWVSARFVCDKVSNYWNLLNMLKTSLSSLLTVVMLHIFVYKLVRNNKVFVIYTEIAMIYIDKPWPVNTGARFRPPAFRVRVVVLLQHGMSAPSISVMGRCRRLGFSANFLCIAVIQVTSPWHHRCISMNTALAA